jgi:hypothetical protein
MSFNSSITSRGFTDEFGDPDLIYYNADIINRKSTNPQSFTSDPPAKFSEIRNTPIINNPRNFEFSIIRCDINGSGRKLPLMIPNIVIDGVNTDPDKLNYSIGLNMSVNYKSKETSNPANTAVYFRENLTFVPENLFAPRPPSNSVIKTQDLSTDYYYLSTYSKFLDIINNSISSLLTKAINELNDNVLISSIQDPLVKIDDSVKSLPPKMVYNPETQLFSFFFPSSLVPNSNNYPLQLSDSPIQATSPAQVYPVVQIWMSENLYDLFASFQVNNQGDTIVGEPYQILYYNNFTNSIEINGCACAPTPTAGVKYTIITQEYPTTGSLWSPIESIVFCSTLLPIFNEYVSNPVIFIDGNTSEAPYSTTSSNFAPLITDISVATDNAQDYRNFISYAPTAEYRMSSINGNQPINAIDIQIFWKSRIDQQIYPLRLSNYSSINLKILFRRRGL